MSTCWASQAADAHADAEDQREADDARAYRRAFNRISRTLTGRDLSEALMDVEDILEWLASQGEAELLGRVVIACREHYVDTLATRETVDAHAPASDCLKVAEKLLAEAGKPMPKTERSADGWLSVVCPVPALPGVRGGL